MSYVLTRHAEARCRQRGFSNDILDLLVAFGAETDKGLLLGRREADAVVQRLKQAICRIERAKDRRLVIEGGHIVTAYKASARKGRGRRMKGE